MQDVLDEIIDPNQTAYLKKRFIGTNIRLVEDVIKYFDNLDKGGVLMFLDSHKAFDSLEWNFMFVVLKLYNFGDDFIRWIKTLYCSPIACVKNNGHISNEIDIQRSVRQGCPVSSLIFILCLEVLALKIKACNEIKGIKLDNNKDANLKITQYADDGTLFLNDVSEMKKAIRLINEFGKYAGPKLNLEKCEGLWIGNLKSKQLKCKELEIKWSTSPIRYLGIYIGHDKEKCHQLNWKNKITKMKKLLEKWKTLNMSIFAKVNFIKSEAISKLIFSATCLEIPENVEKEINSIIYEFLWGSKIDKINRKSAICKAYDGGLSMIDIRSQFEAIKASWISRILNSGENDAWSIIPKSILSKFGEHNLILKMNFQKEDEFPYFKKCPKFYKEAICAYNKSKSMTKEDFCKNIKDQIIWGNRFLKFEGKSLFFRNWIDKGIIKIKNLKFVNNKIDHDFIYETVSDKSNIFHQLSLLTKAFKPFQILITQNEPSQDITLPMYILEGNNIENVPFTSSKPYYEYILLPLCNKNHKSIQKWCTTFEICKDDIYSAWHKRVHLIKDKRIAETQFKILHRILPCNKNLSKWKRSNTDKCSFCNEVEDIPHLLYFCKYANNIWNHVSQALDIKLDVTHILFGRNVEPALDMVICLIVHFIYKEWLAQSLNGSQRNGHVLGLKGFKHELLFHCDTFKSSDINSLSIIMRIHNLVNYITSTLTQA